MEENETVRQDDDDDDDDVDKNVDYDDDDDLMTMRQATTLTTNSFIDERGRWPKR